MANTQKAHMTITGVRMVYAVVFIKVIIKAMTMFMANM